MPNKTPADSLLPYQFLSTGEASSITDLSKFNIRVDGRELYHQRKEKVINFASTNQNTSFVYCLGQTSVHCICTPKLVFLRSTTPDFFNIHITTCNATIITPINSSLITITAKADLKTFFKSILEDNGALTRSLTKNGGLAWTLSINITLLTYEGNLIGAIGKAIKELIQRIKFPVPKIKLNDKRMLKDYKIEYNEFECVKKNVSDEILIPVVLQKVDEGFVNDPNIEEEVLGGDSYIGLVKKGMVKKVMILENKVFIECKNKEILGLLNECININEK